MPSHDVTTAPGSGMTEDRSTGQHARGGAGSAEGTVTPLAAIGYRGRLREIRSPVPATGRHHPWLFLGWVCVVAGLLIPPYAMA